MNTKLSRATVPGGCWQMCADAYLLRKKDLTPYLKALAAKTKRQIIVPQKNQAGASVFAPLANGTEIFLGTLTDFSPQRWFQPEKEKLFEFRKSKNRINLAETLDEQPKVIFGVRACDTHMIDALDRLFLHFYGADHYYRRRRHHNLVIALRCKTACKNGFCSSMGTENPTASDLIFTEAGANYIVEAVSERGEEAVLEKFMRKTTKIPKPKKITCKKKLGMQNITANLEASREHPVWQENAEICLSCSSCTMVCPACYCYYVEDLFMPDGSSERSRIWDSCQLKRFSRIAGNHYFRQSREGRLKQWLFHKFSYFPKHHNAFGCSGCGRCITACPVGIDLTKILNSAQATSNARDKAQAGTALQAAGQIQTAAKRGAGI